jgi:hypothetical protein
MDGFLRTENGRQDPSVRGGYKSTTFDKLWPAAYTYKLLIEKLDGITACRRLPMPDYSYVYECTVRSGRKVLVAFFDDHSARNHDEPASSTTALVPVGSRRVRVTHIVTDVDQTAPQSETQDASGGLLRTSLTEFPRIPRNTRGRPMRIVARESNTMRLTNRVLRAS